MVSLEGFGTFILLLITWAAGSAVLYFASLLSVSETIIKVMLGVCAVCLLASLALFFADRRTGAFLFASGPFFVIAGLLGLSWVLGTIF